MLRWELDLSRDVPELKVFREKVDSLKDREHRTLIKLIYLTASRPCELVTKVSPSQFQHKDGTKKTEAYGTSLDSSFETLDKEKALVIKMVAARRRLRTKGEDKKVYKYIALPVNLKYEPWTLSILNWGIKNGGKLGIDLTEARLSQIIREELSGFDRKINATSLRNYRIAHLAEYYHFEPYDSIVYAGLTVKSTFGSFEIPTRQLDDYYRLHYRKYFPKLLIPINSFIKPLTEQTLEELRFS